MRQGIFILKVGKVSSKLSAKNSVHEISSCFLDIRRHATIVLTSHSNVTAAREKMYVARMRLDDRETLLGWRGRYFHDPIVAIYANFRKRACATSTFGIKARRARSGERSDLPRGNGERFIDIRTFSSFSLLLISRTRNLY